MPQKNDDRFGKYMKKILALDLGERRIGLAISDALQMLAHPLRTIEWHGIKSLLNDLEEIIDNNDLESVVVGLPYTMKGGFSKKTLQVTKIIETLRENLNIPVIDIDERLTTKMAEQALRNVGKKASRERNKIDQIAAVFILQTYLDRV